MRKYYFLDTNCLLDNPEIFYTFGDCAVVLPWPVLRELDKLKESHYNAREALRIGQELSKKQFYGEPGRRCEFLLLSPSRTLEFKYDSEEADDKVLKLAWEFHQKEDIEAIVVTNDRAMIIKANILKMTTQQTEPIEFELYSGQAEVVVEDEDVDEIYQRGEIEVELEEAKENECLILKSSANSKKTALARYSKNKVKLIRKYNKKFFKNSARLPSDFQGDIDWVTPNNKGQQFAFDLLMDENVPLVTLIGLAGAGKSLISVSTGLYQTLAEGKYQRVMIARPTVPVGKDLGFLPGSAQEKLYPWMAPIRDNLEQMIGDKFLVDDLFIDGYIEAESISYMRGRSLAKTFLIIDEAQNLTRHEVKTIITRAGPGTKIVLTGDIEQIDTPGLNKENNGQTYLVEKFQNEPESGHIVLTSCERGDLASKATKLL